MLLVVLMMLLMATGTAVYAMQATVAEQKASGSILEASISRAASECVTMAGISMEDQSAVPTGLDAAWTAGAGSAMSYPTKFSLPVPTNPTAASPGLPFADAATFPLGAAGFICPTTTRQVRGHLLHESLFYTGTGGVQRRRVVITGFGELFVDNDPVDSANFRGIHEVVSLTRAYFDQ